MDALFVRQTRLIVIALTTGHGDVIAVGFPAFLAPLSEPYGPGIRCL